MRLAGCACGTEEITPKLEACINESREAHDDAWLASIKEPIGLLLVMGTYNWFRRRDPEISTWFKVLTSSFLRFWRPWRDLYLSEGLDTLIMEVSLHFFVVLGTPWM